jgi:hypothetical protein
VAVLSAFGPLGKGLSGGFCLGSRRPKSPANQHQRTTTA